MMNKQLAVLLLFFVLMFGLSDAFWVIPFRLPVVKATVSSSWYYSDRGYRVEHNVTGSLAGNQTKYQMKITILNGTGTSNESVYYTTHVNQSNFGDVRFTWYNTTSEQEEEIDYWCEEVNSRSNATFWVEIPEVINVIDNIIYIYYGNDNTATTSNVNATFIRVIDGNQPVVLALRMNERSGNKTCDQSGNNNGGILYPIPVEVNNCDNITDWSGISLTSETNDKVEGSASMKDTITNPTAGIDYDTSYNPSGSWDLSSKKHIVFWLKSDRASTAFTNARLALVDTSNRERYWDISFDADEWTRIKKKLDTFNGEDTDFDLPAVDKVIIRFKAADSSGFYKLIDYMQIDDRPQWTDGRFGKALSFDGENDYVEISHSNAFDVTDELTYGAWVYPVEEADGWKRIIGHHYSVWDLSQSSSSFKGLIDQQEVGGTYYYVSWEIPEYNKWYHVVVAVKRGEKIILYVNGVARDQKDIADLPFETATSPIRIGCSGDNFQSFWHGKVDEVHIYNRALTEEEISDLYNYYGYVTTNYAGQVLVRKRVCPEPTHGAWGSEDRYVPVHDIAVVSVATSSTTVIKGHSIEVLVEAQNEGTESENFNVTAYYDSNIIDTQTNISLKPRTTISLTFTWNTTTVFLGNYNISAQASTVSEETDTDDNIFTDGTVRVIIGYPIAYFTYSPVNPFVNETVTFNATLSTPNGGTLINHTWNFDDGFYGNGVIVYHNYSKTGTYNVTLTVTDSEEVNNKASIAITVFTRNVAIISVTPSTNEIFEGQTMNITVVVQNNGNLTETFNITTYANTTTIQTQTVSNLPPTHQTTLTFTWNTAETPPGNYTIKAVTSITPEETHATQTITVHTPPSWYTPLATWLIGIPPLIWVGISTLIIIVALFRLKIIKIEIEKPLEPTEELQHQINRLLQPLTEKDKRFVPLQQFLHQLLEKNPPPETTEFLQDTFPTIIHSLQENLTRKHSKRVRAKIIKSTHLNKNRKHTQDEINKQS